MTATTLPDDDELLAAELAFGLIDGAERQAAESRLTRDEAFAAAHARWQAYAAALFTDPGEAPRPSIWSAIEARLPANDAAPAAASIRTTRWWQAGTLVATAAALVLAVVAVQKPQTVVVRVPVAQAPTAPMVAVLTGEKGSATVTFDPASGRMTSAPVGLAIGKHSAELWVIPADGKPRSMGVMDVSAPGWAKVPAAAVPALGAGVTLAVTIEPVGGSPSGLPTGPVVLKGRMTATA